MKRISKIIPLQKFRSKFLDRLCICFVFYSFHTDPDADLMGKLFKW